MEKICSAKPYEGDEKYIFVSYCHKDKDSVYPMIEQLAKDGFRVWYDDGIHPGDDWPDVIALHLSGCSVFLPFISLNYINSHNCKNELNFAAIKRKFLISVIMEPVKMSPGMEMQVSSFQFIEKYKLAGGSELFNKLYSAEQLKTCLGNPNRNIIVHTGDNNEAEEKFEKEYQKSINEAIKNAEKRKRDAVNKAVEEAEIQKQKMIRKATEEAERIKEEIIRKAAEEAELRKEEEIRIAEEKAKREKEENIKNFNKAHIPEEPEQPEQLTRLKRVKPDENIQHLLKYIKTNEIINITKNGFVLGRSKIKADYAIDNCYVGRVHATIFLQNGKCSIVDNKSINKTYINGKEIIGNEKYELDDGDIIALYDEKFQYLRRQAAN